MEETTKLLEESILNRKSEIKSLLKNNIVDITFEKLDGNKRFMRCTLMPKYLPTKIVVNEEMNEQPHSMDNRNVIAAWDLDIEEWRSFRITSILDVTLEK